MSTQYVRESVQSRLTPFRQAIEEINSRREDGVNNFTNEEPAVERLLNSIDFVLNTDVEHPGEFFDFMRTALESLPRQTLSHLPLEQVLAREPHDDAVENFRRWIIYSLNLTGSLKYSLHLTLPMRDILSCFVRQDSILFMDTFIDEFLGSLATLHNPPIGDGQTVFKLDAGALQLFQDRPIVVHVEPKKAKRNVRMVRRPHRESIATETSSPLVSKMDLVGPAPTVTKRKSTLATCAPTQFAERTCQTDDALLQELLLRHAVDGAGVSTSAPTAAAAAPLKATVEASSNTDHPSPLMSFQELMEAQGTLEAYRAEQRLLCERIKVEQANMEEQARDYKERMELAVATIRQLKSMYNELFMRSLEAQETLAELTEDDVDARIVDVFNALRHGKTVASREAVHDALAEAAGGGQRKRAGAMTMQQLSPLPSPRPQHASEKSQPSTPVAPASTSASSSTQPALVVTPPAAPPAASRGKSAAVASSVPPISAVVDIRCVEESNASPATNHQMIPVDHTKLVVAEPTEMERVQQLSIQGNRCAGCASAFAESDDKNLVLKVVQKAGETLRLQKPRRCHYCVRLFCHRCHTNKMATLPFRVLQRWDFSPQHVCNRDYEFLTKNYERAFYYLPSLPPELQSRPNVQQAAFLRHKLVLIGKIIVLCAHDKAAVFAPFLHSHYSQREHFYAMSDFSKLRSGEGNRLLNTPMNAVGSLVAHAGGMISQGGAPGQAQVGPAPNEDLISYLTTQFTKGMQHIKECRQCTARSSMRCGLCSETSSVYLVDDDATQCKTCLHIFHVSCWEIASGKCPSCSRSASK